MLRLDQSLAPFRVISLGAGVQSSAVLMLALRGELAADAAIFADTGWEPRAVYTHLERLEALAREAGFPVHRVGEKRSIREVGRFGGASALDAPFFLRNQDGSDGFARRQCTSKFKVTPIRRKIRELRGPRQPVVQLFGISMDEVQRMKTSDVKYITNEYPLIDRGWSRGDCERFLAELGMVAPKSACIGCPFHSDAQWRSLPPDEFADAVAWEREVQAADHGLRGTPFIHRKRVPLDQVDLRTSEERGQLSLDAWQDECAGVCGV